MITGIQDIYYSVIDTSKAKRFYTEVLGMKVRFEHEHWISLDCHGVNIGLHPEDKPIPTFPEILMGPMQVRRSR